MSHHQIVRTRSSNIIIQCMVERQFENASSIVCYRITETEDFFLLLRGARARGVVVGLGAGLFQAVDWALYAQSTLWV